MGSIVCSGPQSLHSPVRYAPLPRGDAGIPDGSRHWAMNLHRNPDARQAYFDGGL